MGTRSSVSGSTLACLIAAALATAIGCASSESKTPAAPVPEVQRSWAIPPRDAPQAVGGGPERMFESSSVERWVDAREGFLRDACYAGHEATGVASFLLVVELAPDGTVSGIRAEDVNGDPMVASCVTDHLSAMQFPHTNGGTAEMTMIFSPAGHAGLTPR